MRKDVKFGLTIGAILVVTLVIYVIVLSRGPAGPQKIGISLPSQGDQNTSAAQAQAESQNDAGEGAHLDDAKSDTPTDADTGAATNNASPDSAMTHTGGTTAPQTENASVPATQPAEAQANVDWEGALNNGPPPAQAAPQRTVTPTIDSSSESTVRSAVARSQSIPLIDSLPATQPSRPLMADIPSLDAPAAAPTAPAPNPVAADQPVQASPSVPTIDTPVGATPSLSASPRTHRVASGESLYTISQSVYGSGKYFKKILAANPKVDPRHLRIGQILVIPELNDSDRPVASAAGSAAPAVIDSKSQYRVESGDTLESISRKLFGNAGMMDAIYEANKGLIGPDENVLKIGWILKLPSSPTSDDAQR